MRPAWDEDDDDDDDDDDYSDENNHIWYPCPKYKNNVITLYQHCPSERSVTNNIYAEEMIKAVLPRSKHSVIR